MEKPGIKSLWYVRNKMNKKKLRPISAHIVTV